MRFTTRVARPSRALVRSSQMSARLRLVVWALAVALAVAALAVFGLAGDHASSARAAPHLPGQALLGRPVSLSSVLAGAHGRSVLVVFWASWCEPCAREAPALERFALAPQGRGRIVGVDWSDALASAREFVKRYAWTFPSMRDGNGVVGNAYRLATLPTSYVIDARGRIRTVLRGPQTQASVARALASVERA
jgi:thiol-disulfide isomerase/thioredoxin